MDPADNGKNQRMGNQDNDALIPSQITKRRDKGRLPCWNMQLGKEDVGTNGIAFLV